MAITVPDLITLILGEIRAARAGDVVNPEDQNLVLQLINEQLEAWSADGRALFAVTYTTGTLTPSLNPHLIGPTGTATFVMTRRPTDIPKADLILPNNIRLPIYPRDRNWWMSVQTPAITASVPNSFYYETDWPNGSLYLWPVPSVAYGIYLTNSTELTAVTLATTLDLPQGYQKALRLTVAELAAPHFGQQASPDTVRNAITARAAIFSNNDRVPTIATIDGGMPGSGGGPNRSNWNWLNGGVGGRVGGSS